MEREEIIGTLKKKQPYGGENPKHPAGYITIKSDTQELSLSLWDEKKFKGMEEGKIYSVEYTTNDFNGKTYYNAQSVETKGSTIEVSKLAMSKEEKVALEEVGGDSSLFDDPEHEILLKEGEIHIIGGFKYKYVAPKLILTKT